MVIFHSYVNVYQRVYIITMTCGIPIYWTKSPFSILVNLIHVNFLRYLTGKSSITWNVLWRYLLGYIILSNKLDDIWMRLTMRDTRTIAILIGKTWKNNSSLFHVHPFPVKQQSVILEQKLWCYGDLKQGYYHQPVLTFSVSNHPKAAQISPAQAMFGIWKLIRWTKTFDFSHFVDGLSSISLL